MFERLERPLFFLAKSSQNMVKVHEDIQHSNVSVRLFAKVPERGFLRIDILSTTNM